MTTSTIAEVRSPHASSVKRRAVEHVVLAVVVLVPQLAAARGVVSSDTKAYLYLDPGRFLSQVTSAWDPTVALGTVTHQYVGYLFPMGPYYALASAMHVELWVAQRVWLAAIVFAAGAGVLRLCELVEVGGPGRLVAAFAFSFSPYVLQYSGRISVILLPWAGLPWLVVLSARALQEAGVRRLARAERRNATTAHPGAMLRGHPWRHPALFALVVLATSGINASSFLYVAIAPVLWLAWCAATERETEVADAALTAVRVGALSLLVSAWWIAGLFIEAGFGVDVLRYTESVRATSSTSTPLEVLRGLGYWYFYGGGRLGPWTRSVVGYTTWPWLLVISYAVPVGALCSGVAVRWRSRGYFVVLVVVGVVLSVGAYPYAHPSVAGGLMRAFMTHTTAGLAMRSTDRATPLALLGLSMLLGAGASALWRARERVRGVTTLSAAAAGGAVCALVLVQNPAMFDGGAAIDPALTRPASLPRYELAALHALDETARGTRVLAIPGNAFAAYTWGDTNDTPQPGVLTRPFVTREQQVMGSMATADTLYALDAPIQTRTETWAALAPMARLLSAGSVMVEYDQRSSLYGAPQAIPLAASLESTPPGLSDEHPYGASGEGVEHPVVDPELLAGTHRERPPPPIVTYRVRGVRPILRAEPDAHTVIVAGDATGLQEMAENGLLPRRAALWYAGTLAHDPGLLDHLASEGATLVVTDTNRKQRFRWNGIRANAGAVETAAPSPTTTTSSSSPMQLFEGAPRGSRTVASYVGAAEVTASSYGNPVTYQPELRAGRAIDGDLGTAWETGTYTPDVDGAWWQVRLTHEVTRAQVTLVQPLVGTRKRHITAVTLTFTGRDPVTVALGARSRHPSGQRVRFSPRRFRTLRVTLDATSSERGTPVGLAAVEIRGVSVSELLEMPSALLRALGPRSRRDQLVVLMTRWRASPYASTQDDPERVLARRFTLPTPRRFTLRATANLAPTLDQAAVDRLVLSPAEQRQGAVASSSSRLTGALASGASAAIDGDPATLWQSGFGARQVRGAWLRYALRAPLRFSRMRLVVTVDRRHSIPGALRVTARTPGNQRAESRLVVLPPLRAAATPGSTASAVVSFPTLRGQVITVRFERVRLHRAHLWNTRRSAALPLGVNELGIPGLTVPPPPPRLPGTCRRDLLAIDGRPIPLRVVGPSAAALAGTPVSVEPCGWAAHGIELGPGRHVVTSAPAPSPWLGRGACRARTACSGWQVDAVALTSNGSVGATELGGPVPTTPGARVSRPTHVDVAPLVAARETSPTTWRAQVTGAARPFELVLGESVNTGWRAVVSPEPGAPPGSHGLTLGTSQLVDAYANGWQVTRRDLRTLGALGPGGRHAGRGAFRLTLVWVPQREEVAGMALSAAGVACCLAILLATWRRRRRSEPGFAVGARGPSASFPSAPELAWPRSSAPGRVGWPVVLVVSVASGACGGAIVAPLPWLAAGVAAALGLAVGIGLRRARLRAVVAVAGPFLLAAAGAMVVVGQVLHPVPSGGDWPAAYHTAASLAGAAVAFLGADTVVGLVVRFRRPRPPSG